ncbi:MAG: hypothetical protein KY453_00440 [Gemmatimonadetes bacterium]|nr:hypothetical protein [Gemmatimonadota bacterium]
MGFRTNPDRILDNIDRARSRESDAPRSGTDRQATVRELDSVVPDVDATNPERMKRLFRIVEQAYTKVAQSQELGPLAARFQAVGDIHHHHAHGDVSVAFAWLDSERHDDIGLSPFEITADAVADAKKETRTSRPDVNAMKVLRHELREGVRGAYRKIEPRLRDALRERADMGHVAVTVTVDLRPAGLGPGKDLLASAAEAEED